MLLSLTAVLAFESCWECLMANLVSVWRGSRWLTLSHLVLSESWSLASERSAGWRSVVQARLPATVLVTPCCYRQRPPPRQAPLSVQLVAGGWEWLGHGAESPLTAASLRWLCVQVSVCPGPHDWHQLDDVARRESCYTTLITQSKPRSTLHYSSVSSRLMCAVDTLATQIHSHSLTAFIPLYWILHFDCLR